MRAGARNIYQTMSYEVENHDLDCAFEAMAELLKDRVIDASFASDKPAERRLLRALKHLEKARAACKPAAAKS